MGKRRLARETALQALYLKDISKLTPDEAYGAITRGREPLDEKSAAFSRSLLDGAAAHLDELDAHIQSIASNWELGRMAAVDRNILRLASYELLHADTPPNAIIDEAIEISKKYGAENSSKFINGILDKIKALRLKKSKKATP